MLSPHPQRITEIPQAVVKPSPGVLCTLAQQRWPARRTRRRREVARVRLLHIDKNPQFVFTIAISQVERILYASQGLIIIVRRSRGDSEKPAWMNPTTRPSAVIT
jgi:hypothetical protein